MDVTQIRVSIHEKRNHPHEFGHYDAEVGLVAQLHSGDSLGPAIEELRVIARAHVRLECARWESEVRIQHQKQKAVAYLEAIVEDIPKLFANRLRQALQEEVAEAKKYMDFLPSGRGWRDILASVVYERLMRDRHELPF